MSEITADMAGSPCILPYCLRTCMAAGLARSDPTKKGDGVGLTFDGYVGMMRQSLLPSMARYTAVISAWVKGNEQRGALDVSADMRRELCCLAWPVLTRSSMLSGRAKRCVRISTFVRA